MKKKDLERDFPYVSGKIINAAIANIFPFCNYKTERGVLGRLKKINDENREIVEMPDVKSMDINMVYRKNSWGFCPKAYYQVCFSDGSYYNGETSRIGGCGYDKTSTALAEVFNEIAKGMAFRKMKRNKNTPYGLRNGVDGLPYFMGGIGVTCYFDIAKFLGLKKIVVHRGITENFYSFSI